MYYCWTENKRDVEALESACVNPALFSCSSSSLRACVLLYVSSET